MKKIILFFSLIILLSGCTKQQVETSATPTPPPQPTQTVNTTASPATTLTCVEQTLRISDPKPNQTVTLPFTIDGTIETPTSSDCKRWTVFEAQAGTIEIRSEDGKVLHSQPFPIEGEWMTQEPIPFSIVITSDIVAPNESVSVVFTSDNPSGLLENEQQYTLPLQIN